MNSLVLMALIATLGTWLVTALGAATVVFFKSPNPKALNLMLGFAAGVMIAASFWSLLQPAIERAEASSNLPAYFVATVGFLFGACFMWGSDKIVSFARGRTNSTQGKPNERLNRIIMLVLSITLHNIPEGLAVGVAFGALQNGSHKISPPTKITPAKPRAIICDVFSLCNPSETFFKFINIFIFCNYEKENCKLPTCMGKHLSALQALR